MNCNETQAWLLHSETPALPPPPLADHLRRCGTCQQAHRQLLLVENHLQSAPLPLVPVAIKAQLMNAITTTPLVRPAARSLVKRRKHRFPLEHVIGYAAAAAASLIVGGLLGYGYAERGRLIVDTTVLPAANAVPAESPKTTTDEAAAVANVISNSVAPGVAVAPSAVVENAVAKPPKVDLVEAPSLPAAVSPDITVPMKFGERPAADLAMNIGEPRLLNDEELLATLVDSHTQTAAVTSPEDRLARLVSLSDVLWTQTVKESQSTGSTGNLEWLGDAYTTIVENDLPAVARELPAGQQEAALVLATNLDGRAAEIESMLSASTPAHAEILRQLQASAQHSSARLTKKVKDPASPRQRRWSDSTNLLPLVVEQTVAIAREDNPIERADHSTALAESFAKDILVTSLRGEETRAATLGGHFGRVLEQGIAVNLKRIDPAKATYQQTRRYQQVVARAQQSILFLQQSLEAAPPGARQSLAVAMQQGGLAQLVPPPGPTRRIWIWSPVNFRWPHPVHRH